MIVAGLGAMGSAALYQLAARGVKALGIDRYRPPHAFGSSHGESRITRQAIGEGGEYVRFVRRSNEIWRRLESETGSQLLLETGIAIMRPAKDIPEHRGKRDFVESTAKVAAQYNIPHEVISGQELSYRYPQFNLRGDEVAYFEPSGGVLFPEKCVGANIRRAEELGANLRFDEAVSAWRDTGNGVAVDTDKGAYQAGKLILCAGAWLPELLAGGLKFPAKVYPQTLHWFPAENPRDYSPARFPVYIWLHGSQPEDYFYGFPIVGQNSALKVASEQNSAEWDGGSVNDAAPLGSAQEEMYERHVRGHLRGVAKLAVKSMSCLYTVTPDSGFILDNHPASEKVWIVSACSGHGFKHSAGVGEAVAEWASSGTPPSDMSPFSLKRFL